MKSELIIVGAGQAACMAAISLRQKKYKGSILIIGSERYLPYQRPPLSKDFLIGSKKQEKLFIKSESFYKKKDIKIITNTTVIKINREKNKIYIKNGESYSYKYLILATGSIVNKLEFNSKNQNIFYLRTLDDALQIREVFKKIKKLVVIGAGYIGLEIAALASKQKLHVSVIDIQDRVMRRSVSPITSNFFQNKHENMSVNFLLSERIRDIYDDKHQQKQIVLNNGKSLTADAVIMGVGIKPNISLAIDSGLDCDNGIIVDEYGRTSEKNIFAIGDCTNHLNKNYQVRLRLESVHNAVEQAKTVASFISGNKEPYNQVPWFWSDQYNLKLQIAGIAIDYDNYFIEGKIEDEKFAIFYIENNKVIAVEAINHPKAFLNGKKLIKLKKEIPQDEIKKSNFNIFDWVR